MRVDLAGYDLRRPLGPSIPAALLSLPISSSPDLGQAVPRLRDTQRLGLYDKGVMTVAHSTETNREVTLRTLTTTRPLKSF